ncbi:DUF2846 domain-containing protein [bacterium]|nr:DUF2846 domain-containing protein [bacterium]
MMKFSYLLMILLLSGCTTNSTRGYFDSHGIYNETIIDKNESIPNPKNNEAIIVLICDRSIGVPDFVSIYLNNVLKGNAASNSFTYFTTEPSEITILCEHKRLPSIQLKLQVNANEEYYFYINTKFENWGSKLTLEKISPEKGEEILERIRSGRNGKSKASRNDGSL